MIPLALPEIATTMGGVFIGDPGQTAATGVSVDTRTLQPGDLFFAIRGPRFDGHAFIEDAFAKGACAAVVQTGAVTGPRGGAMLQVKDVVGALGCLAAYHRRMASARVVAITGSNGKTTTKAMLAHVLSKRFRTCAAARSFNNEIGLPLTLLSCNADHEVLIVEMGTNAPGEIAGLAMLTTPDIGVITSVGQAHLERLGGIEGVRAEKLSLFSHVKSDGLAVVHEDAEPQGSTWQRRVDLQWCTFGVSERADVRVADVSGDLFETRGVIDGTAVRLPMPGPHNVVNAAAVFAVARSLGMPGDEIAEALGTFCPPELRMAMQHVGEMILVSDCYNANPTSMAAAIDLLRRVEGRRRVLVAGEMAELGDVSASHHRDIGMKAAKAGIEKIVAVGPMARDVIEGARIAGMDDESTMSAGTLDEACEILGRAVRPGDAVLLKGSRVARMEELARFLQERFSLSGSA